MFKNIRILILLSILLIVSVNSCRDKNQDWNRPVYVALHPINIDGSPQIDAYIANLTQADFNELDAYIKKQALPYNPSVRMYYRLGDTVSAIPPVVPRGGSVLDAMIWSLKFRYFTYKNRPKTAFKPDLTLFLQYHGADKSIIIDTSTALQNGRMGVVNLFAKNDKNKTNNVVIAHESLHGFGATDKYNLRTGEPIFPDGYANPTQNPLYPQAQAELMAMHKMKNAHKFVMAKTLDEAVVGELTAKEIGWLNKK